MDSTILANNLADKIPYEMVKDILVKPLEPVMVKKQFQVPVTKDKAKDDGLEVNDYDKTTTETREVPSVFERGVVLKMPCMDTAKDWNFKVGDTIVYNGKFAIEFDLFKNSKLVKPYDVVGLVKE